MFQGWVGWVLVQLVLRQAGAERLGGELATVLAEQHAVGQQAFLRQVEGVVGVNGPVFFRHKHQAAIIRPTPRACYRRFEADALVHGFADGGQRCHGFGKAHLQVIHNRWLLGVVGQVGFMQRIAHGVGLRQVGVPVPAIESRGGQQHQAQYAGTGLARISAGFVAQVRQAAANGTQP